MNKPVMCITEVQTTVQFVKRGCPMAARKGYPMSIEGIVTKQAHMSVRKICNMLESAVP